MTFSRILRRIAAALFGILILVYVIYQVYAASYTGVFTETAVQSTISNTVQVTGRFIRQEAVLDREVGGALYYLYNEGESVANGTTVARIYRSSHDVDTVEQIRLLDAEIAQLEEYGNIATYYEADPTQLTAQVYENLAAYIATVTDGDLSTEEASRNALMDSVNQRLIITDDSFRYEERLEELKKQRAELASTVSQSIGQVITHAAGYFLREVDGYEDYYSYKDVASLTVGQLKEPLPEVTVPSTSIGKVATSFEWYIACVVDKNTALLLSERSTVELTVPEISGKKLTMQIISVNMDSKEESAAVVLKSGVVSMEYMSVREETVELNLATYSGILVNQDALCFATVYEEVTKRDGTVERIAHENVKGVYVLSGNKVEFVQVFTDAVINHYAVCKTKLSEDDVLYTDRTIRVYDSVVVKGSELYDGKIV